MDVLRSGRSARYRCRIPHAGQARGKSQRKAKWTHGVGMAVLTNWRPKLSVLIGLLSMAACIEIPPPPPATPTCEDGLLNGDETDVDCGGDLCGPCDQEQRCIGDEDCVSGLCVGALCELPTPPPCSDGVQNGDESGIDCGGRCAPCEEPPECIGGEDCISGLCEEGVCVDDQCADGIRQDTETDVDCGGECETPCDVGQGCEDAEDCQTTLTCQGMVCTPPNCDDGTQNGTESDVDCGGTCPGCEVDQACQMSEDCSSAVCSDERCQAPSCNDGVR